MIAVFGLAACASRVPVATVATKEVVATEGQAANVTQAAMLVLRDACLANTLNKEAMDAWLALHLFRPASPLAAAQLTMGRPGSVWLSGEPALPFAVITRPSGISCQIMAPTADPEQAARLFRETVMSLARPNGLQVRQDADGTVDLGDQPGRRVAFRVGARPIERGGFNLVLSATKPRPGGVALLITASAAPPETP
ncbi:NMCC_0638 family (lipo)protein [Roseomonas elaeocarpi]|uniref:Uncharacterized protein n=1 Tax=Roseomonas elaeocarpi TaxID=907779 RepID=A0ABV6JTX3_9PROT